VIRCFPIGYVADALGCPMAWEEYVLFKRKEFRDSATLVLRGRHVGSDESWDMAMVEMKAAIPARWVCFVAGILPCFVKLCSVMGMVHAQFVGGMYVGAWLVFKMLVFAAMTDRQPSPREAQSDIRMEKATRTS